MKAALLLVLLAFGACSWASEADDWYRQAVALEKQGDSAEAVKTYVRAARAGSAKAATRLAEIYDKGIPGVQRDPNESRKWQNAARTLGEKSDGGWGCPPKCPATTTK